MFFLFIKCLFSVMFSIVPAVSKIFKSIGSSQPFLVFKISLKPLALQAIAEIPTPMHYITETGISASPQKCSVTLTPFLLKTVFIQFIISITSKPFIFFICYL